MTEDLQTGWKLNRRLRRKLRLGMVGGGFGGFIGALHRTAAVKDSRWELVAGALSRDPERARASAENWYIEPDRSYNNYREMARNEATRPDKPDAITIVTTNETHFAIAREFLEAGFNVICDKPLTTLPHEAWELVEIARRTGAIFAVTYTYSGYPVVRMAREMVRSGELGEVRSVMVEYASQYGSEPEYGVPWLDDPVRTGPSSLVAGTGTHAFHLAEFMTGCRVEEISADLASLVPGHKLEDHATMHLRFAGDARGSLWNSSLAPGNENGLSIRVFGSGGGLRWHQESPNELFHSPLNQPTRILRRGGFGTDDSARNWERSVAGTPEGYLEAFANLYSEIAVAILERESGQSFSKSKFLFPTVTDGARGVDFVHAALRSSADNAVFVPIETR